MGRPSPPPEQHTCYPLEHRRASLFTQYAGATHPYYRRFDLSPGYQGTTKTCRILDRPYVPSIRRTGFAVRQGLPGVVLLYGSAVCPGWVLSHRLDLGKRQSEQGSLMQSTKARGGLLPCLDTPTGHVTKRTLFRYIG